MWFLFPLAHSFQLFVRYTPLCIFMLWFPGHHSFSLNSSIEMCLCILCCSIIFSCLMFFLSTQKWFRRCIHFLLFHYSICVGLEWFPICEHLYACCAVREWERTRVAHTLLELINFPCICVDYSRVHFFRILLWLHKCIQYFQYSLQIRHDGLIQLVAGTIDLTISVQTY